MNTPITDIFGSLQTISVVPTHTPKKLWDQVKILIPPAWVVVGRSTIGLVDEVFFYESNGGPFATDVFFPYNVTGQAITSTSTGNMPTPLVSGTTYYVIRISEHICKLATTYANAINGIPINITAGESGIWTITASSTPVNSLYIFDTISNAWKYAPLT